MSDLYTEIIVKKKKTVKDSICQVLLIAATVLSVLMFLFVGLGLLGILLVAACVAADYFLLPGLNLEYEYLYVNGELDVDKIMSKQKRKRVFSADLTQLEILAPTGSHALDSYNQRKDIKTYDFSSGLAENKTYTVILKGENELQRVIFEPNDTILKDLKRLAPREVSLF